MCRAPVVAPDREPAMVCVQAAGFRIHSQRSLASMECTRGRRQNLRCWLALYLALTLALAVGASFDKPSQDDAEVIFVDQPNRSVRSKRVRSTLSSSQPPAVSIVGPVYSLNITSASVRCALLNASATVASRGKWYWTVLYPAAGTHSHLLRAVTNKTIPLPLPASLRGITAVSEDRLESTITLFSVQQLRSYVNVSCLWKLKGGRGGTQRRGSNAQPHTKSAMIYGPPHIADCWLESVSYTSASIDWFPLKTHGKIAPIDRYTLEVVHGTESVQRVELRGTAGHLVLPNVLQPHTSYTATLFGTNSAGKGPPCHVSFATSKVASLAIQTCPVLDSRGHFYLIAAWKPRFPESLVAYHCGLQKEGVDSEVWLESARSQCTAGQARLVPAANSSITPGSYQMEVVESLSQIPAQVTHYTTRLTVDIDYVSASVEYIGDGAYLVTCELACHSQLTGCALYLNSSRTGAVGADWDELNTIPVNAQRDMTLLGTSQPIAVWNFTLYGSCAESIGVQAVQNGKLIGEVKSVMVVYRTTTEDCLGSLHPSSWSSDEMDVITAVLSLFIALICVLCCIALTALLIWSCSSRIKSRGHLHLSHSVFPTNANPIFLRYRPTTPNQPEAEQEQQEQQQQQERQNGDHPQDNAAPVFVHHINLEHVDHSYDCDTV